MPCLNPASPPSRDLFYLRAAYQVARHGVGALSQAVAGGQHANPKGLFFGGARLEEGPAKLQKYMAERLPGVERIVAIDVHTGLGRFGDDRLLLNPTPEIARVSQTMREAFGDRVQVVDTRAAYEVRGAQFNMYRRLLPHAEIYFATHEFGTYHPLRVVAALRAENRWHHYGTGAVDHPTKARLREVFHPGNAKWRRGMLERGRQVIHESLALAFAR